MSKLGEHRRVQLTTISSSISSHNAVPPMLSRFGDFLDTDTALQSNSKGNKNSNKTIRLQLELFETDSYRYPEFNYSKLLHLEKKKAKMLKEKAASNNGNNNDPFADNDDDVARIAKELEAKYGNSYARGRGRRKKDDFVDIGMGYDESDSFIDNTEAYDEILPEEVETLEGGFYINSGTLEFKNPSKKSHTRRTDAIIKMPERSRKRVVSTSSDDSSETSESSSENEQETAANSKSKTNNNADNDDDDDDEEAEEEDDDDDDDDNDSDSDSESIDGSDSDTDSLEDDEESGKSVNTNVKSKFKPNAVKLPKSSADAKPRASTGSKKTNSSSGKLNVIGSSSSSNSPRPNAIDNSDTEEQRQTQQAQAQSQALKKVVKTTTVKDMLKAKRDSFLKSQGQVDGPSKSVVNGEVKITTTLTVDSSSEDDDSDSASEQGKVEKLSKPNDNQRTADTTLPASLDKEILGNINSFKEMVRSRDLCGRRFDFDSKLTALLLKIYETLLCSERNERNMVFAHLEYQLQLPKYFILRRAKALRAREEKNKTTAALEKLRKAVAELMPKAIANYEIELHRFAELAAADVNSEHPPKMPRKKFQWSNELRELLYDVYQARWISYAVLGKRKDSLEQFINGYLKDKVVDVWATGWMRYEELQREIERHKHASKKQKEKAKKLSLPPAATATTITTTAIPTATSVIASPPTTSAAAATTQGNNYAKQYDELTLIEQSRSRANSDTDSATSASSSSLKRKLEMPANGQQQSRAPKQPATVKPPKIKFQKQLEAKLAQMSQANSIQSIQQQTQTQPQPIDLLQLPAVNNYLKQLDDVTVTAQQIDRSRANSDTDSVASASSNSLKRKLDKPKRPRPQLLQSRPKKKKQQQQQVSQQPLAQLDNLMVQPSTSAQAAAMNAAVVAAAASMLELASPTKQTDHSINSIMTAANLNVAAINSNALLSGAAAALHSTTSNAVAASKPLSHVINLDYYKSPSEILQTSQQLAANKWQTTTTATAPPPAVVRCESSSESDGVEIVCVYPAAVKVIHSNTKAPRSKASQKSKATSVISTTGTVANGLNGAVGGHRQQDKRFTYGPTSNNNNNNNGSSPKLGAGVIRSSVPTAAYDYSNPQILKTLSALEKQMNWSQNALLNAAAANAGTNAGAGAAPAAGRGTTSSHQ
ncbi:LOW QUALITY PROTEIN: yemanuclein [Drosophila sulfurigaster albostrigata]|uniref:LOW QUALITY PROTEIN: yemanuclein n=1 Tax=Drosophila sulfurigaster albostrigata TaxID=89887 RepID=UPI002D21C6B4|nr:LOW QUALITY PROTEIN: yemanuclein [Drosophila sulfurigaster albostrigata]